MNKIDRLFTALASGRNYTANQIRYNFGLQDVYHAVRRLRLEGFPIYTNRKVTDNGNRITTYRLGTPSERYQNSKNRKQAIKSLYQSR